MAEAAQPAKTDCQDKAQEIECAVCLQRCVHPAQLPCGHIFCFLCVKGFANQNKKCAMCRQEIPIDFLEQPHLLEAPAPLEDTEGFDGGFQWFYGGRNGWWKYDERANMEIEEAYKLKIPSFELIICGELYVVDFKDNHQYPKKDPSRKRPITRDKIENVIIKGVAGWWQYDERTSKDLESAYKRNEKTCELLIAGFLYIIDLENMLQVRRNDPSRRRRIKRDYHTIPKKGIAGLPTHEQIGNTKQYGDSESDNNEAAEQISEISPDTLTSDEHSENTLPDFEDTLQRLDMLSLNNSDQNDQS